MMLFKLTTLIVLLSFVSVAFSAVARSTPSVHPDHPGKCWDEKTKEAYGVGKVFTMSGCIRVTCLSDFSFLYATCGIVARPPCYVTEGDLTWDYPLCCPSVKCDSFIEF